MGSYVLQNMTYYYGGVVQPSGSYGIIGLSERRNCVIRFQFTTGNARCKTVSVYTPPGTVYHNPGNTGKRIQQIPFLISAAGSGYENANYEDGYAASGHIYRQQDGSFSGWAPCALAENTTYYLWFFPLYRAADGVFTNKYSNAVWLNNGGTSCGTEDLYGHSLTLQTDGNSTISLFRVGSAVASPGQLFSGSTVYREDVLRIYFAASPHHRLSCQTVNGVFLNSGDDYTVGDTDVSVVTAAVPLASAVSATDTVVGGTSLIAITRYDDTYRHTVMWELGEITGQVLAEKTGDTVIPWTPGEEVYGQMTDRSSRTAVITCLTYDGDTLIGTAACQVTVKADPEECAPVVSGTAEDENPVTAALTGDSHSLIRYRSRVCCTMTAEAVNGAALSACTVNGIPVTEGTMTVPDTETDTFTFTALDSRGFSSACTVRLPMVDYVPLTCHPQISRPSQGDDHLRLSVTGNFFSGSFGARENQISLRCRIRREGTGTWGDWIEVTEEIVTDPETLTYRCEADLPGEYDHRYAYTAEVAAEDGDGETVLTSVTAQISIHRGIPVFDWGEADFAFHVPVSAPSVEMGGTVLTVSGETDARGTVLCFQPGGSGGRRYLLVSDSRLWVGADSGDGSAIVWTEQ